MQQSLKLVDILVTWKRYQNLYSQAWRCNNVQQSLPQTQQHTDSVEVQLLYFACTYMQYSYTQWLEWVHPQ